MTALRAAPHCSRRPLFLRGFTLVELMAVIGILAVLAVTAAPGFREMLLNQRLASAAQAFSAALSFARVEAIRRTSGVEVVALAGHDWNGGWAVRTGPDDGEATLELRRFEALPQGVRVDPTLGGGFAQGLRYDSNGFARQTAGSGFGAGCLTLKADTGRRVSIVVSASGRAKTCNPDLHGDCGSGACALGGQGEDGG